MQSPLMDQFATPAYLNFRGKSQPEEGSLHQWHPVAYHCLDVAACVDALLDARPQTLARAARLLRLSLEDARSLLRALALLHDTGKFSESFFGQTPALWPSTFGEYRENIERKPHTEAGYVLWRDELKHEFGSKIARDVRHTAPLFVAAFGHHGRPLVAAQRSTVGSYFKSPQSRQAAHSFVGEALALACDSPIDVPADYEKSAIRASWWIAGMISICDWIGSSQRWFPYQAPVRDIASYWDYARAQAHVAIREAGLSSPASAPLKGFAALTGRPDAPTPAQQWALGVDLSAGGGLYVLEDVTGAGKTEAAQILVHRLMNAGHANGAYWGMPTQATANAMYERQGRMIASLFADSSERLPSLVLTHGQAKLHDRFRGTVLQHCANPALASLDADDERTPSTFACAAFLADDRRAGLLADVGAGTIDQALLGILPSKFNTVRLFGLAEKVLVLDEVHAYDAYMREEIIALLRFHSALGGSAVLLSATLPQSFRQSLTRAWQAGCVDYKPSRLGTARPAPVDGSIVPYPLATVVNGSTAVSETGLRAAERSKRTVKIRFLHDTGDVLDRIYEAYRRGEAVAWIRNTVDSCRDAARLLRERGIDDVLVFHSRFAQCDRQAREAEVMAAFGPESRGARARVLVATQVIEQSLDLDFDTLVTDLAPIDLIIQRAGRLWRHPRDDRPEGSVCELVVLTPRFSHDPGKDWLDLLLPKTRSVYEDVGVLWRTLRAFMDMPAPAIETPGGVRGLVESVYADDFVPPSLDAGAQKAGGKEKAHAGIARRFALTIDDGYSGAYTTGWYSDVRVPTRLIDEQTVIRLARVDVNGCLAPWAGGAIDDRRAWALSEVRVHVGKMSKAVRVRPEHQASIDAIRRQWPKYERDVSILPMVEKDGEWEARLGGAEGSELTVGYTVSDGLSL
jgi:CRISPR-associated endonuclease/helicase Cas3